MESLEVGSYLVERLFGDGISQVDILRVADQAYELRFKDGPAKWVKKKWLADNYGLYEKLRP